MPPFQQENSAKLSCVLQWKLKTVAETAGWACRVAGPRSEIHLDPDTRHKFSPRVGNLFKHLFFF